MDLDKILTDFGVNLKEDLQKSLKSKGVMYGPQSSKLSGKIRYKIVEGSGSVTFQLWMPEYGEYVDKGRRASGGGGSGVVRKNIENWVKRKGIVGKSDIYRNMKGPDKITRAAKQLAFLISRKIHREGFKGTNFYQDVIHDGRLKELEVQIAEQVKRDVVIEIMS